MGPPHQREQNTAVSAAPGLQAHPSGRAPPTVVVSGSPLQPSDRPLCLLGTTLTPTGLVEWEAPSPTITRLRSLAPHLPLRSRRCLALGLLGGALRAAPLHLWERWSAVSKGQALATWRAMAQIAGGGFAISSADTCAAEARIPALDAIVAESVARLSPIPQHAPGIRACCSRLVIPVGPPPPTSAAFWVDGSATPTGAGWGLTSADGTTGGPCPFPATAFCAEWTAIQEAVARAPPAPTVIWDSYRGWRRGPPWSRFSPPVLLSTSPTYRSRWGFRNTVLLTTQPRPQRSFLLRSAQVRCVGESLPLAPRFLPPNTNCGRALAHRLASPSLSCHRRPVYCAPPALAPLRAWGVTYMASRVAAGAVGLAW